MSTTLRPTPSPTEARIRTPLARARGLGSAKEGTSHFWLQRITAVANLVLAIALTLLVLRHVGGDATAARAALSNPLVSLLLAAFIVSGTVHMRLGMQVIIEDYVHAEGRKFFWLMMNNFFAILIALASVWAVLKLSFGA